MTLSSSSPSPSPAPGGATTTSNNNNNSHGNQHPTSLFWWTMLLPVYMGWRIWWANRMPIMDCDEVYNYWEPLHFMLFGSGFQTWEYSQQYALRTYAYLLPLRVLSQCFLLPLMQFLPSTTSSFLLSLLTLHEVVVVGTTTTATVSGNENTNDNRLALMVLLRATMAASMALAEVCFLEALANYNTNASDDSNLSTKTKSAKSSPTASSNNRSSSYSQNLALVTAWLMITSTGMSHASGALLPSTTLTVVWLWAARAYLKRQFISFVIWAVLATLAIGWPFGVLLFAPLGVACLVQQYRGAAGGKSGGGMSSVLWLLCCALAIAVIVQGIVSTIDYMYYDRWVSPVYNILLYNTHAKGDELYGVEPTSYYIKNLLLNFNYVAVAGVTAGPVVLIMLLWRYKTKSGSTKNNQYLLLLWDLVVLILPMYVWLGIVVPRPHKEERFLFPIYPILCLGAAIVGNAVLEGVVAICPSPSTGSASQKQQPRWSLWLQLVLWTPAAILGGSRTVALTKYYTAPLQVYAQFQKEQPLLSRTLVYATIERGGNDDTTENSSTMSTMTTTTVCTCGEWYRFPSSFYLPTSDRSIVNFKFVSPSPYFEGQLPHAFLPQGSGLGAFYPPFNDKNMPEYDDRYVPIDACDYLVDATWGEATDENVQQDNTPSCRDNDSQWLPISKSAFLDADRTSTLHRILYLPKLHEQADFHGGVEYVDYVLYRRIQGEDDDA